MDISGRRWLSKAEQGALEIISTVGCSLSLAGVILTIFAHVLQWKKIHRNVTSKVPSKVLVNLCVAIGMTNVFAILAGPARNEETFCIVTSILLYFSVLASFGWMLCEGVVIHRQLVNVYASLSLGGKYMKAFYAIGWGLPVIMVAVLVGINRPDDFISEHSCWCRAGGALFWTFVAIIGLIFLINISIFVLALRNTLSSRAVSINHTDADSKLRKAEIVLKGSAVLLPILGLTWVFGLLVFNRETIMFKYLFAIFNSLQGLMIFVFHVLLNVKFRNAFSKEDRSYTERSHNYAMVRKNNTYSSPSNGNYYGPAPGVTLSETLSRSSPMMSRKNNSTEKIDAMTA
ncbi:adhesion G-protein coupled receptor D1-like [Dendronephthya gigantea]|uniref:adhesion G-protein coupled receptor D1-like n=1 Tax=Dendronephthya gigantea TaxID=151771 RepID=UPI00106B92D1|nr:adhesion G-protein coupled receptor D1-like [Dendronephthya gigantea]